MSIGDSVDTLSQIIDRYETDGGSVQQVDAAISGHDDGPSASVDVLVSPCDSDSAPETARLEDGTLQLEFDASVLPALEEYAPDGVRITSDGACVTGDGDVVVTFAVEFEDVESTEREGSTPPTLEPAIDSELAASEDAEDDPPVDPHPELDAETVRALADARDEDVPPYEDVPYLEALYESLDTFEAMADVLEMDVAAETVRRYMIDAGVHDPVSYDVDEDVEPDGQASASEPEPDSPDEVADPIERLPTERLAADGLGLPEGVDLEELIDAVESSMTLREVCRRLELERERARELLAQLDLLDLVVRRVYASSEPEAGPSREVIAERIRGSTDRSRTPSEGYDDFRPALS
ncbi:hypothetical protein [Natronococcus occultus]|uniref:Uncharacterized protein n=1 Tax=Natronococcus occultus SP4 TaxID=694430 RepID=L0K3A7_9EURY|nr:hypothetical protein [Natronococcus occultus]AGB39045.1 hypothetical protein Natoc_3309 [Natronococcus occultus SP4]